MMKESKKEALCGSGYKLNGYCANVAGWKSEYAAVSPCTGGFYRVSWEDVKRVADTPERDFKIISSLFMSSGAWLGIGCDNSRKACEKGDNT